MLQIKKYFIFIVKLKFQKRSALKFVSRTIHHSGGYNTQQRAAKLFPQLFLKFIPVIIALLFIYPFTGLSQNITDPVKTSTVIKPKVQKPVSKEVKQSKSGLTITPEEINLGFITFDKQGEGIITLNKTKSGVINWSTQGPEGWTKSEEQQLSGELEKEPEILRMEIRLLHKEFLTHESNKNKASVDAEIKIESGNGKLVCTKELSVGTYKEEMKIDFDNEQKKIFISFNIAYTQKSPSINLNPVRLDLGSILPEKAISKKIILNNIGKEMLKWSVVMPKHDSKDFSVDTRRGRYLSFVNSEEALESGFYTVPAHLKEVIKLTGKWTKNQGYPSCDKGENEIKINFSGTGIILYLLKYPEDGNLTVSINNRSIDKIELFEVLKEKTGELLVAENLDYGSHVLTITGKDTPLILEGVKVLGVNTSYFPEGTIKIFPNSGAITRQSNYLTVSLNAGQMQPGFYVDDILFTTNGGDATVEVYAEILSENISKVVDIYRYYNGSDYLYTADPQSETQKLIQDKYVKEGIAFRLFKPDTPGTKVFYRWYNPQTKSHFYHYIQTGGGKDLRGYVFERSIGNIATSKLTNTRELYRWYNSKTGHYFYSTDLQGGKINKKAYRFDGIAGYVK